MEQDHQPARLLQRTCDWRYQCSSGCRPTPTFHAMVCRGRAPDHADTPAARCWGGRTRAHYYDIEVLSKCLWGCFPHVSARRADRDWMDGEFRVPEPGHRRPRICTGCRASQLTAPQALPGPPSPGPTTARHPSRDGPGYDNPPARQRYLHRRGQRRSTSRREDGPACDGARGHSGSAARAANARRGMCSRATDCRVRARESRGDELPRLHLRTGQVTPLRHRRIGLGPAAGPPPAMARAAPASGSASTTRSMRACLNQTPWRWRPADTSLHHSGPTQVRRSLPIDSVPEVQVITVARTMAPYMH